MPLYEFFCTPCKKRFETLINSSESSDQAPCPKCGELSSEKLISRFSITGQGDQRESTMHGCHEHYHGTDEGHHHDDEG